MRAQPARKSFSIFLAIVLFFSGFTGFTVPAAAAAPSPTSIGVNNKTRHVVCHYLSDDAQAYYTGQYAFETLITLSGTKTTDSTQAMTSPLFSRLKTLMSSTLVNTISYNGSNDLTAYWKYTDASNSSSDACLFYSDAIDSSYNREHVWPKSNGNFHETGAGADIHHLRPTNATVNSTRGNQPFGNVRKKTGYTVKEGKYGTKTVIWYISGYSANGCDGLVEVADDIKGDVARILLYVYVTYGNASTNTNTNLFTTTSSSGSGNNANAGKKIIEDLDTLLEWCAIDPVDEWEMRRNDLCQKVQGNRNVFIDYPEFAWCLFGVADEMPADMDTPSGYASSVSTNYNVTADSNNTNWGTVSISGKVITASPKSGYYAAGYTVTSGSATVVQEGNTFTVTPSSDCTVRINFAAKQTVLVNYMANGSLYSQATAYTGDTINVPTGLPAVEGWTFLGWVAATVAETATAPATIYTTTISPSSDMTLYALYEKTESGSGTGNWTKMTSGSTLQSGLQVVLANSSNNVVAGALSGAILSKVDCTNFSGNIITALPSGAQVFTLGGQSGAWTFTSSAGQLCCSEVKKLNLSGNGSGTWNITIANDGTATVANTTSSYGMILYNTSSPRFTTYASVASPMTTIELYYLDGTGGTTYYTTSPVSETHEHELTAVAANAATCTAAGNTAYWYCSGCGRYFSDANAANEITQESTVIAALGHNWGAWTVVTPATTTSAGLEERTCSRCNAKESQTIPKLTATYTVTFTVPAGVTKPAAQTAEENTSITLPSSLTGAPNGWTFLGWVVAKYDHVTTKPADNLILTGSYSVTGDITLKALFSYTEGTTPTTTYYYQKVTSTSSLENGTYLIVNEENNKIFNGSLTTSEALGGSQNPYYYAITSTKIPATEELDARAVTLTKSGNNYKITTVSGFTIGLGTNGNALNTGSTYTNSITFSDGNAIISSTNYSARSLRYNPANNMFRYYTTANNNQKDIQLFKRIGESDSVATYYYTTENDVPEVVGYSLRTGGDILVNAYIHVPEDMMDVDDEMYVTLNDGNAIYLADITNVPDENGVCYTSNGFCFPIRVPAKQMHDTITLRLYDGAGDLVQLMKNGTYVDSITYSVQGYLDQVIANANNNFSEELIELCKAMSDYGSYAQAAKEYDLSSREDIYHPALIAAVDPDDLVSNVTKTGETDTLKFKSVGLVMESETVLRFYFRYTGTGTLTAGGKALTAVGTNNYYYFEMVNIPATDFAVGQTVTVTDGTDSVTVSGLSVHAYVKAVLNSDAATEVLKNVCRAIVVYGNLAEAYFN